MAAQDILLVIGRALLLCFVVITGFAYLTWVERKLLARFQVRIGPNRAGPFGLLQPAADAVKAIFKEEYVPRHVDKVVYVMAPALALAPALIIWAVIPIAKGTPAIADVNIGFLWILAVAGIESFGVILAGWSSNNNYALLGALRSAAQIISYEIPLGLFLASIAMLGGTFSLVQLVETPRAVWEWIWVLLAFPFFFISVLAETNRSPFDLPETENELIAGFFTEYGGMKFSMFMMAEYINMITTSTVVATLFFGGWRGPLADEILWLGPVYLGVKVLALLFLFIWIRGSVSRPRFDQVMRFNWKVLIPLGLIYLIVTAVLTVFVK